MSEQKCLSPEELEAYLEKRQSPAEQLRTSEHLAACAVCRTEIGLFQEFHAGTVRAGEANDVAWISARLKDQAAAARGEIRQRWWHRLLAAPLMPRVAVAMATVLLMVSAALWLRQPGEPGFRPSPGEDVMRSQAIAFAEPIGDVPSVPTEFRWVEVQGAAKYQLRVMEVDGVVVWEAGANRAFVEMPLPVRDLLQPGKTLIWEVAAMDTGGKVIASGRQTFRRMGARHESGR
jgi:hypothetical protein